MRPLVYPHPSIDVGHSAQSGEAELFVSEDRIYVHRELICQPMLVGVDPLEALVLDWIDQKACRVGVGLTFCCVDLASTGATMAKVCVAAFVCECPSRLRLRHANLHHDDPTVGEEVSKQFRIVLNGGEVDTNSQRPGVMNQIAQQCSP